MNAPPAAHDGTQAQAGAGESFVGRSSPAPSPSPCKEMKRVWIVKPLPHAREEFTHTHTHTHTQGDDALALYNRKEQRGSPSAKSIKTKA